MFWFLLFGSQRKRKKKCINCTDFSTEGVHLFESVSAVCTFSMSKSTQAVCVTAFLFHSEQCADSRSFGWQEVLIKSFFTLRTFQREAVGRKWLLTTLQGCRLKESVHNAAVTLLEVRVSMHHLSPTEPHRGHSEAVNPDIQAVQSYCDWVWASESMWDNRKPTDDKPEATMSENMTKFKVCYDGPCELAPQAVIHVKL